MTEDDDEKLTQSAFGARLEMSRQRVSRFVRDGVLPTTPDGKIPWLAGLKALIGHLSEVAAGRGGGSAQVDLSKERALLARAQRESVELKNAIARGEYLVTSYVRDRWDTAAGLIRAGVLAAPTTIAQALAHLTRHDIETIDRILRDALTEAADAIDGLGDIGPASEGPPGEFAREATKAGH